QAGDVNDVLVWPVNNHERPVAAECLVQGRECASHLSRDAVIRTRCRHNDSPSARTSQHEGTSTVRKSCDHTRSLVVNDVILWRRTVIGLRRLILVPVEQELICVAHVSPSKALRLLATLPRSFWIGRTIRSRTILMCAEIQDGRGLGPASIAAMTSSNVLYSRGSWMKGCSPVIA